MRVSEALLYRLAKRWPSPMAASVAKLGEDPSSESYLMNYAQLQFDSRASKGVGFEVRGREVLEIGCGHGGISCFMAVVGAKRVVGIDLNTRHLEIARKFTQETAARFGPGVQLPVEFFEMNAYEMTFPENSFDVAIADNTFEHFMQPETVMQQAFRILRPGGRLVVPIFSSILSKYGLHLKHGLKMPWANLLFSEKTIVGAMKRLAQDNPTLNEIYPGLLENPQTVCDLRRYKDLNDITYAKFKTMAERTGYQVERMRPITTLTGKLVRHVPVLNKTRLMDILSVGASAVLLKKGAS